MSVTGNGVRCLLMRGGTSKGAFFLGSDLPADPAVRDDLLLRIMGSPDPTQIDGLGGAQPVTSKVAVVSRSTEPDCDIDYLFLQVGIDAATVSDRQTCGNLLAAIGQFAVERGLVTPDDGHTSVRIRMVNTGGRAESRFATPGGRVAYTGDTAVAGVPGTAAAVALAFAGTEGSVCGRLLPTGRLVDEIDGLDVTCIDNGMPVVVARAADFGPDDENPAVAEWIQSLRLQAGKLMGLGDVTGTAVPRSLSSRRRGRVARSAPARSTPSTRSGRTPRSGCSARSAWSPRRCWTARSATSCWSGPRPATRSRWSTPAARCRSTSTSTRTAARPACAAPP
jgi:4-oxalomesaconate tautomerase